MGGKILVGKELPIMVGSIPSDMNASQLKESFLVG